ncbi:hypothetical protein BDEG_27628 [Batrachochytrium dendrobatidis JEL423]|uniref:Uncharacterized protein n=1 Tax=Batrachochytrium dendrobatidis (strain JEL423) TaxID=403673 RepID=A0A177WWG2_BATDL|nr:hypothetical protein BDEG_27628 [Batrachochytrium dendrobatidis JEL423]
MKFSQAIVLIAVFSATANAIVVPAEASVSTGGPDATSTDQSSTTSTSTPSATSTSESSATSTGESGASGYTFANSGEGSFLGKIGSYFGYAVDTARCYGKTFWKHFQLTLNYLDASVAAEEDPDVKKKIEELSEKFRAMLLKFNEDTAEGRENRFADEIFALSAEFKEKAKNGEKGAKEALVKLDGIAKEFGQGVENLAQIVERDRLEASKNGEEEEQE